MSGFLTNVLEEKAQEVALKKRGRSFDELVRRSAALPVRSFRGAIAGQEAIIAEVKRKSPTVKAFRQRARPEQLAVIYADNGAAAISVVTDERHFGCGLDEVRRVRDAVSLPILVKDFIIDEYQVAEARAAGADAVLLIARAVTPERLGVLTTRTDGLGMSALVECHDAADIEAALSVGAHIIGINNRDLDTLEVSLKTTRRLVALVPSDRWCVAESGITSRRDIEELTTLGVSRFLVGAALLNAPDAGKKLRELCGKQHVE